MIKPDPVQMENESGRLFAIELLQQVKKMIPEKEEEAVSLKDQSQDIPDDFYETKWVRFYMDQRHKPQAAHL